MMDTFTNWLFSLFGTNSEFQYIYSELLRATNLPPVLPLHWLTDWLMWTISHSRHSPLRDWPVPDHGRLARVGDHVLPLLGLLVPRAVPAWTMSLVIVSLSEKLSILHPSWSRPINSFRPMVSKSITAMSSEQSLICSQGTSNSNCCKIDH